MNPCYLLDACALIALLTREDGGEMVKRILRQAANGKASVRMHKLNLLEVYYDAIRSHGKEKADEMLDSIRKTPIEIIHEITDKVFNEAGRLKVDYKVSLADTIALAEALISGDEFLTADHHEFNMIEGQEKINFHWIR